MIWIMSRSDSEHLEFLKLARDQLNDAILARKDATLVTYGTKTVSFSARDRVLMNVEKLITRYEIKVSRATSGAARNRIRLGGGNRW